jgi:hypothetical protein
MSQRNSQFAAFETPLTGQRATEWDLMDCDKPPRFVKRHSSPHIVYAPDWANSVPNLIAKLASQISEKKKLEIRFNLLEILAGELQARISKLESVQTKIIPINTFAPEPYELLKTFLVSVQSVEGGFEAGWFDANIHSTGDNEEEAVSNLKSLILDFFEIFSSESPDKLGLEPKRQLEILKQYIQKKA